LADDPRRSSSIKLVGHEELWRHRTGDYHVVYHIDDEGQTILILFVRHRREVYRDLDRLDPKRFADFLARGDGSKD
jgi:mRNA-degrading endonuclease RelE of RelBE toxin-antitoxin system